MMIQKNDQLVNRVASSDLITINLEDFYPSETPIDFDLKEYLFQGLILKEMEFRSKLKEFDWSTVKDRILCVYCSTNAIIPRWAYMLVATTAAPYAKDVFQMDSKSWINQTIIDNLDCVDFSKYAGKRIVIKGCGKKEVASSPYLHIAKRLQPHAQSIMFGEPCSTVPIFKRPRKKD